MFRRRPPRRPLRSRRPSLRPPKEIIRAYQLMEVGNYQEAAEQFERIARVAESRGGPRAPHYYLQAGRARIFAGHNRAGLAHLKHGLSLLVVRADWLHLYRAGNRTITDLNQRGLAIEANEISDYLKTTLPADFSIPANVASNRKPVLPTHCPSCGGAIRPDEVDWLDEITAECAYCGSPIRDEK